MNALGRFVARSKKSGEQAAGGIALDAASYLLGHVCTGLKMNDYFFRKEMQGSRLGWTKYASGRMSEKMRRLNPPDIVEFFSDKAAFDARFEKYLGREWFDPRVHTAQETGAFLQKHPDAIAKPRAGKGGSSVEQLSCPAAQEELERLQARLIEEDKLVEEHIRQHEQVSEFYPKAVNTIRVTTFYTENGPVLLAPLMRIGCGDSVADNFDSGGVLTMLDVETGRMLSGAMNKKYVWFDEHPESGKRFEGFVVPHWQQVRKLCLEAAQEEPRAAYIGWDVAITPEGCVLVEGNARPSINWQCVDRRGWRKEFAGAYKSAKRKKQKAL